MKNGVIAAVMVVALLTLGRGREAPRDMTPVLMAKSSGVPAGSPLQPLYAAIDSHNAAGVMSNINGFLEPGETVQVDPFWTNVSASPQTFTGTASNLTGPAGPTYTIDDASADYGTVPAGQTTDCDSATGDCYLMTVSGARPVLHWDATFVETLSSGAAPTTWTIHIGNSFFDVPTTDPFYAYVERLLHMGVTTGCGAGNYCPSSSVTRAQMAVFLLKAEHGSSYTPPACTPPGIFGDVPCPSQYADWIEQLFNEHITGGCQAGSPPLYCPTNPVTRAQMAVFILKTEHGSSYVPPPCAGIFDDVPCPSLFADWIEQLHSEGITGGCSVSPPLYCPNNPVLRGQMAVFLVKAFGPPAPPVPTPTVPPPTLTPTITLTPSVTPTVPSPTPTLTPSITQTFTNSPTFTNTRTFTSGPTLTFTPTGAPPTLTPTITQTFTFTRTNSNTRTATNTRTFTPTITPNGNHIVFVGFDLQTQFVDQISGTSTTTIPVGTTVEWLWQNATHSTTSGTCNMTNCIPGPVGTPPNTELWDSGQHSTPFTFTHTFNNVGTFTYFCSVHNVMMQGLVNVLPLTPTPGRPAPRR
jgi:plastocyanin